VEDNIIIKEALLLQTDRATRCQPKSCQPLHNHTNKLHVISTTNRVVDFLVDRRVRNCVRWHVDRRDYGQHARRSASFVDNPIDKVPEKSSLILEIPEFLYNKV